MADKGLTASEAAFVLEITPEQMKKAFDKNLVPIRGGEKGNRLLGMADLVLLRFHFSHPELSAEQRRRIADALAKRRFSGTPKGGARAMKKMAGSLLSRATSAARYKIPVSSDGAITVDLSRAVEEVERGNAELERLSALVEPNGDGEPQITGTDIPVYRVAALVKGDGPSLDVSEARKGFPSLATETIEAAYRYGRAYPKKGRPFPGRSVKSRLEEIAFPVFDDEG